jgi:hypothetical protein
MLKAYLQEEIVHEHLYGSVHAAYVLRRVAWNWGITLDQEYIEIAIATAIRDMGQGEFIEWLDQQAKRDRHIRSY